MKKLIRGIVEFRKKVRPGVKDTFAKLALGQITDTLFIACSDGRVVPNLFASTDPGDLFVLRNVGNIVPPCGAHGLSASDESEVAALEFAILNLKVSNIIVCGHSECGATQAILNEPTDHIPHLKSWLKHGATALENYKKGLSPDKTLSPHNQISQLNVLQQIEHIKSYPVVQMAMKYKQIEIHGWWFDIAEADVYAYDKNEARFILIDEFSAEAMVSQVK